MRTDAFTSAHTFIRESGHQSDHVRISVKDSGGTFRDLTTYAGVNMVETVLWSESVADPHAIFSAALKREHYKLSLSPFMDGSALNKGFDYSASANSLIALNREVKIECAVTPMDKPAASGDWFEVFRGRIDTFDPAKGENVEIGGRSLGGRLAQQYIKTERVYSFAKVAGVAVALRIWEPSVTYAAGEYLLPASRGDSDPGFNRFYKVHTAGTSGTTEPVWTTGSAIADNTASWDYIGAPTTSGNDVEQIMQNLLDDNKGTGDPTVTLYVPISPGWAITQYLQQRTFTLDAVRALALQIGWDLRYKWKTGTGFVLTLYMPNRTIAHGDEDWVFGPTDYEEPEQLSCDIAEIRNSWRGIYTDAIDVWPDGVGKRKVIERSSGGSIAKYGELWAEIQEDSASQIDSATEMTNLLDSAVSDCSEPTAVMTVPLTRGFPWAEVNDFYEFSPNGRHFDSAEDLAVTGWQQEFSQGVLKTRLDLRGKPTIGAHNWLSNTVHPDHQPAATPHRQVHFQGPRTPGVTFHEIVGGNHAVVSTDTDKVSTPEEYEIHIYPTSGTTLDSTTLAGVSKSPTQGFAHLEPGRTYYSKTILRHKNGERLVRGQPSAEVSFVAGRALSGHIGSGIALGDYPLNGGFETRFNTSGLPDHWSLYSGAYSTNVEVVEDTNGVSGKIYVRLKAGGVRSAIFPIVNEAMESGRLGGLYRFAWWRRSGSSVAGGATYSALIRLLDYADAEVDILTVSSSLPADDKLTHWVKENLYVELRAGDPSARSLQLILSGGSVSSNQYIDVDEVRCQYLGSGWFDVGDTSNHTDNYESIPGFNNSYAAFGSGDSTPSFRRNQFGRAILKGAYAHGTTTTVGSSLVTLPPGFRPPRKITRIVPANGKDGLLEISTGGVVTLVSAADANPSTKISLDGIEFDTHE